jgi:serine/threonine protein kinase/tetratricopeptide (TPR) repeat protein
MSSPASEEQMDGLSLEDIPVPPDAHPVGNQEEGQPTQAIHLAEALGDKPGDMIGPYKLLQEIGEGGCGIVYVAEQERPIRRRVALKVVKPGMDSRQVLARFEAERQVLALLDHPHICKVLDAGATALGRPFFVMELVKGTKITAYCDHHLLSLEERLELFGLVCHAIHHAHQKGIVHRDLKPSNILTTLQDQKPVPKIIDFGIAKAIAGQVLTDKTLFTVFELFLGTPAYMSPEQAAMSGLEVDARSDVYSLGVLLYELLTGRTPFDQKELLAAGFDEMRRIIRETEPTHPSAKLSALEAEQQRLVGQSRRLHLPDLIRRVEGDLDWIVMRSLEKDRSRRYESAYALALDVQRHVKGEPILARPSSSHRPTFSPARRNQLLAAQDWPSFPALARAGSKRRAGAGDGRLEPSTGSRKIESLALLPLLNLSGDPKQEYFVDGITELLCTELGSVSALKKVTSRTTIMQYKATSKQVPQIAMELGVDAVVEGSVQREGNSVLVSIQLIDGHADRHLWARNYAREVSSLLKFKTELAREIASEIMVQLTPEEESRLATAKSIEPAALEAYLNGRCHYWSPGMHWSDLQLAEDSYQQAVALDPTCARAYAGLADVYILRMFRRGHRAKPWLDKALQSVHQALVLDDSLPEAHTAAAWVRMMHDWDWTGAEREVRRAIQLNPSYSQAHTRYGHLLCALGRFDEAAAEMKRGQELDPLSPLSNFAVPTPAYLRGDYTQAFEQARQLLNRGTSFQYAHYFIAATHLHQRRLAEAIAEAQKLPGRFWEVETEPIVAEAYALSGERARALQALEQIQPVSETGDLPAYSAACVFTALGDDDEAFHWLERAFEDRSGPLYGLGVHAAFRRLHPDPRFSALLRRMNLRS